MSTSKTYQLKCTSTITAYFAASYEFTCVRWPLDRPSEDAHAEMPGAVMPMSLAASHKSTSARRNAWRCANVHKPLLRQRTQGLPVTCQYRLCKYMHGMAKLSTWKCWVGRREGPHFTTGPISTPRAPPKLSKTHTDTTDRPAWFYQGPGHKLDFTSLQNKKTC